MISYRDIYAAANLLNQQHGNTAAIQAAMCADEFDARSDIDGQRAWIRIMRAIEQLKRKPAPGESVN